MPKMSNPLDPRQLKRLVTSHEYSRKQLRPYRENMRTAVQWLLGRWGGDQSIEKQPLNYIELATGIYQRQIAANVPQCLITSPNRELRHSSEAFQLAMNHLLDEIGYGNTQDDVVMNALFSGIGGILKVGVTPPQLGEVFGYGHDAGQPFADCVSNDEWVQDMTVKRWEQCQYMGDRFSINTEAGSDFYKEKLKPTMKRSTNEDGDETLLGLQGDDRVHDDVFFAPVTEVWEMWLPMENLVVTLKCDDSGKPRDDSKPLDVVEWDGPEMGPYHRLTFAGVPGSIMAQAPISILMDIHEIANRLFRKTARQADRQKDNTVVQSGQEDDGRALNNSNDGDTITFNGPVAGVQKVRSGGADAATMALGLQLKDMLFTFGGNLDSLGGLSPQADTLGQEEIVGGSASVRIERMQERAVEFTRGVYRSLGSWMWYDPLYDPPLTKPIEGTQISVQVEFTPEMRNESDYLDYNVDFVPFSMQSRSPARKVQALLNAYERIILPAMPLLEAQGLAPDINALLAYIAKYSDQPEIGELIVGFQPIGGERGVVGGDDKQRQSPVTTRKNVRINRPGATRQGKDDVMMRALMGQASQPAETAALGRGVG